MVTSFSAALFPFTGRCEGFASRAYRDPGGILTIGHGLTMLDETMQEHWPRTRGHALQMGDTITREESEELLGKIMNGNLAPKVAAALPAVKQHEFDGAGDGAFNFGAGGLKWKWAQALARGEVGEACRLLRQTALTDVMGHHLVGLERRREAETRLIGSADYGTGAAAELDAVPVSTTVAEVRAYQKQLATLGYYAAAVDGIAGSATVDAVGRFQRTAGLKDDGRVGPATRAALKRAIDARRSAQATAGAGAGGAGVGGASETPGPPATLDQWGDLLVDGGKWALVAAALVLAAFIVWRYRGLILRRRTRT